MYEKFRMAVLTFVWAALEKLGLDEKVERIARGETVFVNSGIHTAPVRLSHSLAQPGATDRGQLGFSTVIAAVGVLVAVLIAIVIADNLDTTLGDPSSTDLSTARTDVLSGFGDMASLVGPLFIVAIAAVIIFQIRRIQQ